MTCSAHSCSMCISTLICHQPDTHHSGGNADVQMVHASRWVVVVQMVMHVLMGAVPATPQHMTQCLLVKIVQPSQWPHAAQLSVRIFLDLKLFLSWALKVKKVCNPVVVTYNVYQWREQGTKVLNSLIVIHFDFPSTSMQYL